MGNLTSPAPLCFLVTICVHERWHWIIALLCGARHASAAPTVCVEVKPKWGGLPTSPCVHPDNSLKLHTSKFQLQQALKLSKVHALRVIPSFEMKSLSTELQCPAHVTRSVVTTALLMAPMLFGAAAEIPLPRSDGTTLLLSC